jgi:hypothetical protein
MFKQLSSIEESERGYSSFECSWDGLEDQDEQEFRGARTDCGMDPSIITWTTEASNRHWIALAQGIEVWVAVVSGKEERNVKRFRDYLSSHLGWKDLEKFSVDKIEAASRELDTAIRLWFDEDDPVSIHLLACSAYQIFDDVNTTTRGPELLYNSLVFKDEYRSEAIRRFKKEYNFFKHADTDPSATIEFNPEITPGMMLFACFGLKVLGQPTNELRDAFATYMAMARPRILKEPLKSHMVLALTPEVKKAIFGAPRKDYLDSYRMMKGSLPIL